MAQPEPTSYTSSPGAQRGQSGVEGRSLSIASSVTLLNHPDEHRFGRIDTLAEDSVKAPSSSQYNSRPPVSTDGQLQRPEESQRPPRLGYFRRVLSATAGDHPESLPPGGEGTLRSPRPWRTTLKRLGPLSGIFGMLLAIASIFASLGVLIGSNHAPVRNWSAPPSTYIAIYTAFANLAMRYACIQGVIIAWWYRAISGSTLAKLHWDWRAGTTLVGALTSGRHIGLLGLACIASTFVVIDGPLLQRASTVIPAPVDKPILLNISMTPQIPRGYTGYWQTIANLGQPHYWVATAFGSTMPGSKGTVPNNILSGVSIDVQIDLTKAWFYEEAPLEGVVRGCPDKCTAKLTAPALSVSSCKSHQIPVDFNVPWNNSVSSNYRPTLGQQDFFISNVLMLGENESINLVTGNAWTKDCKGVLNYTACTLESAIGEYDISIEHDLATLDNESVARPNILGLSKNVRVNYTTDPQFKMHVSTLGGISDLHWYKWDSSNILYKENGQAMAFVTGGGAVYSYMIQSPDPKDCPSFDDPLEDMLASFNKLTVYTGMLAARNDQSYFKATMDPEWANSVNRTITGLQVGNENVFKTNFSYFLAAALVEIVCVALVAPTYWGWWKIGRPVSFSPVEMAKAFESPVLVESNSNSSGRDLAKFYGESDMVKYGARADDPSENRRLAFSNPHLVDMPQKGEYFGA